jgi:hypothetical protein
MMMRLKKKVRMQFGNKDNFDARIIVRLRTAIVFRAGVMLWDKTRVDAVRTEVLPILREGAWRYNLGNIIIDWCLKIRYI